MGKSAAEGLGGGVRHAELELAQGVALETRYVHLRDAEAAGDLGLGHPGVELEPDYRLLALVETPEDQVEEAKDWLVSAMTDGMAEILRQVPVVVETRVSSTWG